MYQLRPLLILVKGSIIFYILFLFLNIFSCVSNTLVLVYTLTTSATYWRKYRTSSFYRVCKNRKFSIVEISQK